MRKKTFAIIILLIMLASIPLGVYLVKRQQEIRLRAAPATVLSLEPATADRDIDEIFTINIKIESDPNIVIGADLYLSFDPQILEAQSVSMGTFLPNAQELTKQIDNTTGNIIYGFYTSRENAQSGTGILAQISFKGKAAGTSLVTFGPLTSVADIDEGEVKKDAVPGSYTIAAAVPTATPTPITSPTETPTPGGGTPTESPTPTPTGGVGGPEATATPTPTPTTAAGTTSTPTPTLSEELPEAGFFTSTLLFLIGGGVILALGFLSLLL